MVMSLRWKALSASVRGASHELGGNRNQDAVRLKNPSGSDDVLLLAVADGHGSARSFRSDRGSAMAAECALRELRRFIRRLGPDAPLSQVRQPGADVVAEGAAGRVEKSRARRHHGQSLHLVGIRRIPGCAPDRQAGRRIAHHRLSCLWRDADFASRSRIATSSIRNWATGISSPCRPTATSRAPAAPARIHGQPDGVALLAPCV